MSMNVTVRGETNFGVRDIWSILTIQTKGRIMREFLTGTPEVMHHLECLQITITSHNF